MSGERGGEEASVHQFLFPWENPTPTHAEIPPFSVNFLKIRPGDISPSAIDFHVSNCVEEVLQKVGMYVGICLMYVCIYVYMYFFVVYTYILMFTY